MASIGGTDEEPVLFADGGGSDGISDEVVVDLDATVVEVGFQRGHLREGVADGLAHGGLGQEAMIGCPGQEDLLDAVDDGPTFAAAADGSKFGTGALLSKPGFDPVEGGDLTQDPSGLLWDMLASVVEVAPGVAQHPTSVSWPGWVLAKAG